MAVMRFFPWLLLAACQYNPPSIGDDDDVQPDAEVTPDAYVLPEPELFPGGGIGDGPIVAGINVFVVDEDTDVPVAGASITIGAVTGTTDANGLFATSDPAIAGKQSVLVTAGGYRPQLWVGVEGANVTIQIKSTVAASPVGVLSGNITGFASVPIGTGTNHFRRGNVEYTQHDNASDRINNLPNSLNGCTVQGAGQCNWALQSRVGTVAVFASISDLDTKGNSDPRDDDSTVVTFAYKRGITVISGTTLAAQDLTVLQPTEVTDVTTTFGTLPAEFGGAFAFLGLELGDEGTALVNFAVRDVSSKMPATSVFPGSTYRVTGLAFGTDSFSVPIVRGLSGTALAIESWPVPPTNITATRQQLSFTAAQANIHTTIYEDDVQNGGIEHLAITIFDDTTTLQIPPSIALPTTALRVEVGSMSTRLDVTSFGFDAERAKLDGFAIRNADVN